MKKVLFVDKVHPYLAEQLTLNGYDCEFDYTGTKAEIAKKISNYTGLIIRSRFPIDAAFLKTATSLKFIGRSGAGLENIDLIAAKNYRISVYNSPEGNQDAVAEHAIGMLLMLFNQLKKADNEVRQGIWDREGNRGLEIWNKTVGIIGYGHMGKAFAKRLSGFGCKIIAYDKYAPEWTDSYTKSVALSTIQNEADIISLHLPISKETIHYIDSEFIQACKKPVYLINTARGKHICLSSLSKAIKEKKIAGVCLDVLEIENAAFEIQKEENQALQFLLSCQNVLFSPHVAGWTVESYKKLSAFLAEKILYEK